MMLLKCGTQYVSKFGKLSSGHRTGKVLILTVSWGTCMWIRKQQLEPRVEQVTSSGLRKEYHKAVYCHPAYLTYMQNTSCEIPGWMSYKLEYRWEKHQQPQISGWYHSNGRKWRKTKEPVDEGEKRVKIEGEKVEAVTNFLFLGSKLTADGDCSHEIRRRLLLGRKAMTNLDSGLKSKDITLLREVYIIKAMVFPVVMYRYESWQ